MNSMDYEPDYSKYTLDELLDAASHVNREKFGETQRGRAAAVMVSMQAYEESQLELDILRLLARGEKEIEAGAGYELDGVLKEADRFLESAKH